jgi:hypothetical protein
VYVTFVLKLNVPPKTVLVPPKLRPAASDGVRLQVNPEKSTYEPIVVLPLTVRVPDNVTIFGEVEEVVKVAHTAEEQVIEYEDAPGPLFALIITSSALVGTEAPPAPPEVADQFVVLVEFQVPEPPTQYLVAMLTPE